MIDNLCAELHKHSELRKVWGLGMVRVTRNKKIVGKYHDIESNSIKPRFLGITYHQAMNRVNHVKSFL